MHNNFLFSFYGTASINLYPDYNEKIANSALGLLRIACGKTFKVQKISTKSDKLLFNQENYSTLKKIMAMTLFLFAFPFTFPLALIGLVTKWRSSSFSKVLKLYQQSLLIDKNVLNQEAFFKDKPTQKLVEYAPIVKADENFANGSEKESHSLLKERVPQTRKLPPLSLHDTIFLSPTGITSVHGSGILFKDEEIIEKLDIIRETIIDSTDEDKISVQFTKNNKPILQQQATRGCTAATAAMLILERGKKIDSSILRSRNLGTDEAQLADIKKAGLNGKLIFAKNLNELKDLIEKNGSAIVSTTKALGGHVIVVDEISQDLSKIRLRDPYHGWEITIGQKAFLNEWAEGNIIQIVTN